MRGYVYVANAWWCDGELCSCSHDCCSVKIFSVLSCWLWNVRLFYPILTHFGICNSVSFPPWPNPDVSRKVQECYTNGCTGGTRRGTRRTLQRRRANYATTRVQPGCELHGIQLEQETAAGVEEEETDGENYFGRRRYVCHRSCEIGSLADAVTGRTQWGHGSFGKQSSRWAWWTLCFEHMPTLGSGDSCSKNNL